MHKYQQTTEKWLAGLHARMYTHVCVLIRPGRRVRKEATFLDRISFFFDRLDHTYDTYTFNAVWLV